MSAPNSQYRLKSLDTGITGFTALAKFADWLATEQPVRAVCCLGACGWFDANLCAAFAAASAHYTANGGKVTLRDTHNAVQRIWQRNGFGRQLGLDALPDGYETTIAFRRFPQGARADAFAHVSEAFQQGRPGLPAMTDRLLSRFRETLCEVFLNAYDHAEPRLGVFACGQYYHKKKRLRYTIADTGVGFRERLHRSLKLDKTPVEAVQWAMDGNTTRTGPVPGGLGLQLIREFVGLNGGRLVVVSDRAYWELAGDVVTTQEMPAPWPGAALTLEIRTDDVSGYDIA